jgi:hypothetical protein
LELVLGLCISFFALLFAIYLKAVARTLITGGLSAIINLPEHVSASRLHMIEQYAFLFYICAVFSRTLPMAGPLQDNVTELGAISNILLAVCMLTAFLWPCSFSFHYMFAYPIFAFANYVAFVDHYSTASGSWHWPDMKHKLV